MFDEVILQHLVNNIKTGFEIKKFIGGFLSQSVLKKVIKLDKAQGLISRNTTTLRRSPQGMSSSLMEKHSIP
jgi:hypothetical protein